MVMSQLLQTTDQLVGTTRTLEAGILAATEISDGGSGAPVGVVVVAAAPSSSSTTVGRRRGDADFDKTKIRIQLDPKSSSTSS
jgi:hypothetical protein